MKIQTEHLLKRVVWGMATISVVAIHCYGFDILQARKGLKPFEYMDAPSPLPNYVPSAKWGTQGDPIKTMQKPLSPVESMKHLVVPNGFSVSLFASEPDIAKPIWMAWDERGRLWIAETVDYPNDMQPPGEGHDRIKICEDTRGSGHADKFTIFADHLSVPTGFVFANGGIIVVHSGRTEFLKDTDGDGRADVRQVLFSGWGTNDTHAGPSNLHYGFDNWIWGTVGYSGFEGTIGGKHLRFGQGIYRFKPDGSALEFVRSSNNNTWGLGLSEDNLIFGSTANGNASMYMPIPNRYYERVTGWSAGRLETIADSQQFFPITEKVRQMDWHGKYTAGAGSALYTARSFPRDYWNRAQFVAEPTGHLLGKFNLEPHGADFIAHNEHNFAASDDEWTSPICAEVGSDGALWLIDWYSYIIQHNPTPQGFRTGKGNAYETPLRDKTHGRIYRISYGEKGQTKRMRLDGAGPKGLVAALRNDNLLWRMTAQRLLVERGRLDVVPALCGLVQDQGVDEIGLNAGAVHALWTLKGLGALDSPQGRIGEAVKGALTHRSSGVRKAAVMVVPRTTGWLEEILKQDLLMDSDAQVGLAAFLAISEMPPSTRAARALSGVFANSRNTEDRWWGDALTCAAAQNAEGFLMGSIELCRNGAALSGEQDKLIHRVATHLASPASADRVVSLLLRLGESSGSIAKPLLEGILNGWPRNTPASLTAEQKQGLQKALGAIPKNVRGRCLVLINLWGLAGDFTATIAQHTGELRRKVGDSSMGKETRVAAATELIELADQPENIDVIMKQVTPLSPPEEGSAFIHVLAESRIGDTGGAVVKHWGDFTPAVRVAAAALLLRRAEWSNAFLDAIETGTIKRMDLTVEQWSQFANNPQPGVAERALKLAGTSGAVSADRVEIVKRLLPLAKEPGDPVRGREVFKANCAVCHTVNGEGGKVGPELTGIGARDHSEILIDILDPNRSVEANYRAWNVFTKDGESFSGRLETETQTTVEILDTAGQKHVVQRKDIEKLAATQLSIMPNGFESLAPEDLKALLTFLTKSGK